MGVVPLFLCKIRVKLQAVVNSKIISHYPPCTAGRVRHRRRAEGLKVVATLSTSNVVPPAIVASLAVEDATLEIPPTLLDGFCREPRSKKGMIAYPMI